MGGGRNGTSFVTDVSDVLVVFLEKLEYGDVLDILHKIYSREARKIGMTCNPQTFVLLSMDAMKKLEENSKPNLV